MFCAKENQGTTIHLVDMLFQTTLCGKADKDMGATGGREVTCEPCQDKLAGIRRASLAKEPPPAPGSLTAIAFTDDEVTQVRSGQKHQTRRIIQPQPHYGSQVPDGPHYNWPPGNHPGRDRYDARRSSAYNCYELVPEAAARMAAFCPWGRPGAVLTVDGHADLRVVVTHVRVERLKGITGGDCIAEGVVYDDNDGVSYPHWGMDPVADPRDAFWQEWDRQHVYPDEKVKANAFVYVLDFALHPGDQVLANLQAVTP